MVGYHRETHHFREEKSTKELTAPQHTRFILPPIHPDKIHRCAAWAVFFFMGTCRGKAPPSCCARPFRCLKAPLGLSLLRYACKRKPHLENFMSRPNVIPAFCQRRCKTGAGTSFGANGDQHTRAVELSTYFCVLTIRKQLPRNSFERSGRGQEPSRGHKFSILENFLSIRDFTSSMRLHFRSDLVGAALVGATPLHLLSQTALPLKSPTGAFIAPLRFANAVPPQTLLIFAPYGAKERRVVLT